MRRALLLLAVIATTALPAAAQDSDQPIKLRLVLDDAPSVGRKAPPLVLPYATRRCCRVTEGPTRTSGRSTRATRSRA